MAKKKRKAARKRRTPKVSAAALRKYKASKGALKRAMYSGKSYRVVVG